MAFIIYIYNNRDSCYTNFGYSSPDFGPDPSQARSLWRDLSDDTGEFIFTLQIISESVTPTRGRLFF